MNSILILDTSYYYLSISLISEDGHALYDYISDEKQNHAKTITTEVQRAISKSNIRKIDIRYIAINTGPGSFTGLRVGASTAKGLALALNAKLISICGLEAYAMEYSRQKKLQDKKLYLLKDARRENYFYTIVSENKITRPTRFESIENIKKIISKEKKSDSCKRRRNIRLYSNEES